MVGHVFNAVTVDGDFGLFAMHGTGSFDEVTIKTDDPGFSLPEYLIAASLPTDPVSNEAPRRKRMGYQKIIMKVH